MRRREFITRATLAAATTQAGRPLIWGSIETLASASLQETR